MTHLALLLSTLKDAFLDRALTDEPVHGDLLRLTETMGTVHRLLVNGRVPVTVVEDHLATKTRYMSSPAKQIILSQKIIHYKM